MDGGCGDAVCVELSVVVLSELLWLGCRLAKVRGGGRSASASVSLGSGDMIMVA